MISWYRTQSALLIFCLLLIVEACTNSTTNDVTIKPPIQQVPIPSNACAPNFQYGYTDKPSYFPSDKVIAFLQSNASIPTCRLDIYDVDDKLVFSIASGLFAQTIATNASENGYGFSPTVSFEVPQSLKSGIYLIERLIPFIVKTRSQVDLTIVYPENTANAYEKSGGKSLYSTENRPSKVSFLRPIALQSNCVHCLKWFTTLSNASIGYVADRDLDDYSSIEKSKLLIIPGHNEYWTRKARKNFDRFVDTKGDALILSGNTMWWQVRYTDNLNELICHKNKELDPIAEEELKTVNWYESFLNYSIHKSIGADFNRGGYGLKTDAGWDGYKIVNASSPLLEGLTLKRGDILKLPSGEYDGAPIKGFDINGFPMVDNDELGFHKVDLVGYDKGSRLNKETIGTFIVMQKTKSSGILINAASNDWCSEKGMGGTDGDKVKIITSNAINKLLNGETVFSN